METKRIAGDAPRRREVYATDAQWVEIKMLAREQGLSNSRYLLERPAAETVEVRVRDPKLPLAIARLHAEIESVATMAEAMPGATVLLPRLVAMESLLLAISEVSG